MVWEISTQHRFREDHQESETQIRSKENPAVIFWVIRSSRLRSSFLYNFWSWTSAKEWPPLEHSLITKWLLRFFCHRVHHDIAWYKLISVLRGAFIHLVPGTAARYTKEWFLCGGYLNLSGKLPIKNTGQTSNLRKYDWMILDVWGDENSPQNCQSYFHGNLRAFPPMPALFLNQNFFLGLISWGIHPLRQWIDPLMEYG